MVCNSKEKPALSIYLFTKILFQIAGKSYVFPLSNKINHLSSSPVIRIWNQEICSLCGLRFESCGCSNDGHWRFTWSLTSGPVGLVEVHANWSGHLY